MCVIGWGGSALSLALIAYSIRAVNNDVAKKMVIRGCLLQFAIVASGQLYTMKFVGKIQWNTTAGYVLLLVELLMTTLNVTVAS